MKTDFQKLLERLSEDYEPTPADVVFLESIQSLDDIQPQSDKELQALAYDAAIALGATVEQAQILIGERKAVPTEFNISIHLYYHDGEYLSGYTLHSTEAKLMETLGLAKYISGWGYHVRDEVVKKLGTDFSGVDAWTLVQPAIESRERKRAAEKAARQAIFDRAQQTGERQILDKYSDECNDPREECDIDTVTVYAMPDGTTETVRSHTW